MLKQITYFQKRDDLDMAAFRSHWQNVHADIVTQLPGIRRYVQNHIVEPFGDPNLMQIDGIAEVWFDDIDAMRANRDHPALAAIREDEPKFFDTDTMGSIITEPSVFVDGTAEGEKLVVLVSPLPGVEPMHFHQQWRDEVGPRVAEIAERTGAPRWYGQDHLPASAYDSGREFRYSGMATFWYEDRQGMAKLMSDPAFGAIAAIESKATDLAKIRGGWAEVATIV